MHRNEKATCWALAALSLTAMTVSARTAPRGKPPRLPRASPITLNLGDQVSINGQLYQVGYSLIPVGTTPTPTPNPIPTPSPTTISGIRNRTTGQLVTSAAAGTPLQLEGTGLGQGGRLQLGGRYAAIPTSWTDTAIQFTAPDPGPAAFTGGWDLYWPNGSTFTLKASTGAFTLQPASGPSPNPNPIPVPTAGSPQARLLADMNGAPVTKLSVGIAYQLTGDHFGSTPGKLSVNASPATVTQWTDGKLLFLAPANILPGVGIWATVRRADGVMSSSLLTAP